MNGFLLDTNVISEVSKTRPSPLVQQWFKLQTPSELFISVITLGELRKGTELLAVNSLIRLRLEDWYNRLVHSTFHSRILDVTQPVAEAWGELTALAKVNRRTLPGPDGLIAATALAQDLTLVTRNVRDFNGIVPRIINPWDAL